MLLCPAFPSSVFLFPSSPHPQAPGPGCAGKCLRASPPSQIRQGEQAGRRCSRLGEGRLGRDPLALAAAVAWAAGPWGTWSSGPRPALPGRAGGGGGPRVPIVGQETPGLVLPPPVTRRTSSCAQPPRPLSVTGGSLGLGTHCSVVSATHPLGHTANKPSNTPPETPGQARLLLCR